MYHGRQQGSEAIGSSDESPLGDTSIAGVQQRKRMDPQSRQHETRVLLVGDEPAQRQPLELLLEKWGYRVTSAECGTGAIQLAHTCQPSIALLDLKMPDLSGYQLAALLETRLGHNCHRLFAVSGSIDNWEAGYRLFDRMLEKPVNARTLRDSLQATFTPESSKP